MLPESGCKSKKENLKRGCFRYITIYLTFIQNLFMQGNYSAPPMGMSNRLTVVLQQELH